MRLLLKFNVILGLVLITGLEVTARMAYHDLNDSAQQQVIAQAGLMMAATEATRKYTNDEIATLLNELNGPHYKFHKQEVPAYAARRTFERLKEESLNPPLKPLDESRSNVELDLKQYTFRQPSDNPILESDKPTQWEQKFIDYFRDRDSKKEPLGSLVRHRRGLEGVSYLDLGEPIVVETGCLKCHDTPENAPPGMLASEKGYRGGGFNWYEGQIIGAKIVTVPRTEVERLRDSMYYKLSRNLRLATLATFVGLNLALFWFVIRPVKRLTEWAGEVSTGDWSRDKLPVRGKDEIAMLTESFNRMYNSLISSMDMPRKQER